MVFVTLGRFHPCLPRISLWHSPLAIATASRTRKLASSLSVMHQELGRDGELEQVQPAPWAKDGAPVVLVLVGLIASGKVRKTPSYVLGYAHLV